MKLKWRYDTKSPLVRGEQDIDLYADDVRVGWVSAAIRSKYEATKPGYYILLQVVLYDEDQDVPYPTKYQAMRALRQRYIMHRISGGTP